MTNISQKLHQIKDGYRNNPLISATVRNQVLQDLANILDKSSDLILDANLKDLALMQSVWEKRKQH